MLFALVARSVIADTGRTLVEGSGIKGGLIVCLNGVETADVQELRLNDRCLVQCLLSNEQDVAAERRKIRAAGCYGPVSVRAWTGSTLPYVDSLVNLIVAEDCRGVAPAELYRVLAPNGVVLSKHPLQIEGLDFTVGHSGVPGWTKAVKNWPARMDEWTHWLHGPDGNAVSTDAMPAFPKRLQWQQPPLWLKSHQWAPALSAMVTANGRLFYILDDSAAGMAGLPDKWYLIARDAFNGVELWKHPIKEWGSAYWLPRQKDGSVTGGGRLSNPDEMLRRLVAVGDRVFVTLGLYAPVAALDAATGRAIHRYDGTEKTFEIVCRDGRLILAVNHSLGTQDKKQDVSIMAVDAETGTILWESKGHGGIGSHHVLPQHVDCRLTLGKERVFFMDRGEIVALDLQTGETLWKLERPGTAARAGGREYSYRDDYCTLVYHDGLLLFSQPAPKKGNLPDKQMRFAVLSAVDAETGKELWSKDAATLCYSTPPDVLVSQGLVWMLDHESPSLLGLEPATGAKKRVIDATVISSGTHHNCYRNKATGNLLFYGRNKGVECFDLNSGQVDVIRWIKGACRYGVMPANGMLYAPSHMCGCKATSKLNGIVVLSGAAPQSTTLSDGAAVTRGVAFGREYGATAIAGKGDWPMYRCDIERRAFQSVPLSGDLKPKWTARPGGSLTPPIVAGKKVFLASKERHQVFGLEESSGSTAWTYTADGRIDSPPAYFAGRLVFGGRDGAVYCLDADSGELIWRLRAAPADAQVQAFGQLESAWPVSGSVLVHDGKVYFAAGRSTMLHSGIALYILDIETGTPLKSRWLDGEISADLLVGDGDKMHMRGRGLDMKTLDRPRGDNPPLLLAYGGFLDDSFFNSAYWEFPPAKGSMLVLDSQNVYGVNVYGNYILKSSSHSNFHPGGGNCILFASESKLATADAGRRSGRRRPRTLWSVPVPILPKSLVVGLKEICIAGVRDQIDANDPWAHYDGRKGAHLMICSKATGETEAEFELASPPVFDGMASANGSLFISCRDGSLVCLGR